MSTDSAASIVIHASRPSGQRIAPYLFAKFCEHLGHNIYHGMEAQILLNCTFGRWQFYGGDSPVDGGHRAQSDHGKVLQQIRDGAQRFGHDPDLAVASYEDGVAYGWLRLGAKECARYSPDTGPAGGRAQRMEVLGSGTPAGLWQPISLPLHRTNRYNFCLIGRAEVGASLRLSIRNEDRQELASANLSLADDFSSQTHVLDLPEGLDQSTRYRLELTSSQPCNVVIARALLYPSDAVDGLFDPEIIQMLRDTRLPLLRWPGGNFVSGYHWMDGIGAIDQRPTRPNPAWAGLEFNRFGTAEFIRYCRDVGCEPLICINAGDGTPEEAANWVQYCNGSADTPMGRLRASHGYAEPFNVRIWEVGNELWGKWQVNATTPGGHADRFRRFATAMRKADPTIELLATGAQCLQDQEWTHTLLERGGTELKTVTDHILAWHPISADSDPMDVFQGYMTHAVDEARQYRWTREQMLLRGIKEPVLAITEMQLFPSWKADPAKTGAMTQEQLVRPNTLAEATYFFTWLCECVRLDGFVRMITHSAVVNHGGGLQKHRERTFAHPIHYAHVLCAPLHNARVVPLDLHCSTFTTTHSYGFIPAMQNVPVLDAIAAEASDGTLLLYVASRAREPLTLSITLDGASASSAEITTLCAEAPWSKNTPADPTRIIPNTARATITDGTLKVDLSPAQLTRIRFT